MAHIESDHSNDAEGLVARIARHRRDRPDRIAVKAYGSTLTWAQLDDRSTAIAQWLLPQTGAGEDPILILTSHDLNAVLAFVAARKAGRPVVFLDVLTPVPRLAQIASLATPVATLVAPEHRDLAAEIGDCLGLILQLPADGELQGSEVALPEPVADELIGLTFTSGSTGVPKGVMLGDRDLVAEVSVDDPSSHDSSALVAMPHTLSFFAGIAELTRSLAVGAELHLYSPRTSGIDGMLDWIADEKLTHLRLTPHLLRSMARAAIERKVSLGSVRSITSGGEPLPSTDVALIRQVTPPETTIVNATGSSEGWLVSRWEVGSDDTLPVGSLPGGQAPDGKRIVLRNPAGEEITALGEVGEIHIVADRMSRGYWREPARTAERFSVAADGKRDYNTGDMGRWVDHGVLQYAGRADHMLKIRGYLVEPAEVEKHLMAEGELAEAVVVGFGQDGSRPVRLVAYVVPAAAAWVSSAALRRRLARDLPSYMVPQTIVELSALPHNPNGKVDRLALDEPPLPISNPSPKKEGWNSLQLVIGGICAGALGLEGIGLNDSLIELGADSLATEEIITALKTEVGISITSADLLAYPTIGELAQLRRSPGKTMHAGVLTLLAGSGDATPLFLVSGAGALALQFRELAAIVGADRKVYGLQALNIETRGRTDVTIGSTARRYIKALQAIQPCGPYLLGGHSLGGVIVYEMANQLTTAGEQVDVMCVLDTVLPDEISLDHPSSATPGLVDAQISRIMPGLEATEVTDGNPIVRFVRDRFFHGSTMLTRRFIREWRTNRFAAFFLLGGDMIARYRWPELPVEVDTLVYLAAEDADVAYTGWQPRVRGEYRSRTFPGDHLSMLRVPFVNQVGEALRADLNAADVRQPVPNRIPQLAP